MSISNFQFPIFNSARELLVVLFLACALCLPNPSQAAELKFDGPAEPVMVNSLVKIDLKFDAQGENYNAIGGELVWPSDLEMVSILTHESLVSLWVEAPNYDGSKLKFAGTMPGGYKGSFTPFAQGPQPGVVFSVLARPKRVGDFDISFGQAELYANDGTGKLIDVALPIFKLTSFGDTAAAPGLPPVVAQDRLAPTDLRISIEQDEAVAQGKWFLIVSARDNESGIKGFYFQESASASPGDNWIPIGSPFVLPNQKRDKTIFVKVVDLNGNESVTSSPALFSRVAGPQKMNFSIIFAILIVVALGTIILIIKMRRH